MRWPKESGALEPWLWLRSELRLFRLLQLALGCYCTLLYAQESFLVEKGFCPGQTWCPPAFPTL